EEKDQAAMILLEAHDLSIDILRLRESALLLDSAERERNRLRDVLTHTPAGIGLVSGKDHRWTFVNEDLVHLLGRVTAAELLGKTLIEAIPELESQPLPALLEQVSQSGAPCFHREIKIKLDRAARGLPDEGYFDFRFQPIGDGAGNVESIYFYVQEM